MGLRTKDLGTVENSAGHLRQVLIPDNLLLMSSAASIAMYVDSRLTGTSGVGALAGAFIVPMGAGCFKHLKVNHHLDGRVAVEFETVFG